ncbi:hypothetical protein BC827DRAFT_532716 [Russula dissimulans]|nr:hypothetical protein BC827DRAFT_532716 [Russula dissimulans]
MKFFGALAALSMAALVLASPEPLAKRQNTDSTGTTTSVSTPATATPTGTDTTTLATTHSTGTDTGSVTASTTTVAGTSTGNATTGSTATSTKTGNAAVANIRPFHISATMLTALATSAGGALFGAWVLL